ncbi:MAG: hypothetical protein ACI39Q_07690 [Wujia sp.]
MSTKKIRSKKTNGYTKGSQSPLLVEQRQKLGIDIIRDYDFKLTKREFHTLYYKAVLENPNIENVTMNTIYNDRKDIVSKIQDIYGEFHFLEKKPIRNTRILEESKNIPIPKEIIKHVRNIRLEINGRSFILYNTGNNTFKKGRSFFIDEQLANIREITSNCDSTYMIHLYIIFDVKRYQGVENYLCSFYKEKLNYIIFTSTHNYCSEIVTEYENLEKLITDTWKIFKKNI